MNPVGRSTLILCAAVATAACVLGYLGYREAFALPTVSIFGTYANSRAGQAVLVLIAVLVGTCIVFLPLPVLTEGEATFNHWFYLCGWLLILAATAFRLRKYRASNDA